MERSSAKNFFNGSPLKGFAKTQNDLANMNVRASQRSDMKKGLLKAKANLGLDYEGVEKEDTLM